MIAKILGGCKLPNFIGFTVVQTDKTTLRMDG